MNENKLDNDFKEFAKKGCKSACSIYLYLFVIACIWASVILYSDRQHSKTGQFYDPQEQETGEVYVCTGRRSHAYHSNRNCIGLKSCSKKIVVLTIEEAKEEGRTPCHFCHN